MKLQFEPDLDYQRRAIDAIADILDDGGHAGYRPKEPAAAEGLDLVVANRQPPPDDVLLANVRDVQRRNGLPESHRLGERNFTVEMETGTGKTYVYLRTMFELHRRHGYTKFIVVVPSIAIKEGVHKSLRITREHFRQLYDNVPCDYFVYDSRKLGQIRNFSTTDYPQIMIINIDAFRRSFVAPSRNDQANVIHRPHDRMMGHRPIELIQATRPIVVIDEPQTVDTTEKSSAAIAALHPLCTVRYSATHLEKHHMMYRLDSFDAHQQGLVKSIEVAGIEVAGIEAGPDRRRAYVGLLSVDNRNNRHRARIELDVRGKSGEIDRRRRTVKPGDDLFEVSGGREPYRGCVVQDIHCAEGNERIRFVGPPHVLRLHESVGDERGQEVKRFQIRKTIEEHFAKERRLRPLGVKVLSLFFLDRVANYRSYDGPGSVVPGPYMKIFQEECLRLLRRKEYRALLGPGDPETRIDEMHGGYFADDRKHEGRPAADVSSRARREELTYHLIMRDKERLLGFDCPLRFVFSHSALREGWDNPNVFQICTLNETGSTLKKRQEIGRGLRIAVDQRGRRVFGREVNRLTIVANESYDEFARRLQREIAEETGSSRRLPIDDARRAKFPDPTDHRRLCPALESIWREVEQRVTYELRFDVQGLLQRCTDRISRELKVRRARLRYVKSATVIGREGMTRERAHAEYLACDAVRLPLADAVELLRESTSLTRRSIRRILHDSGRLEDFPVNPTSFVEQVERIVRDEIRKLLRDGVRHQRAGSDDGFTQDLFDPAELTELSAEGSGVTYFTRLPDRFRVETPLGDFHPVSAVHVAQESLTRLYMLTDASDCLVPDRLREQ